MRLLIKQAAERTLAVADSISVSIATFGDSTAISTATVLANDSGRGALSVSSVQNSSGCTAVLGGGNVTFTPSSTAATFQYTIADTGSQLTSSATVTAAVTYQSIPWSLSQPAYTNVSFSLASQDILPDDIFFKSDGTKAYVVGDTNNSIFQYSLSTAWDLSTMSYDSVSFSVATETTKPDGISFKSDGTKMYVCNYAAAPNAKIFQYSLTAWDLSTAAYDTVSFSVDGSPSGLAFKSDGTKMYVLSDGFNRVSQYSLSAAWDLSTASDDSVSLSVSAQSLQIHGLAFKSDGTKMYVSGTDEDKVFQYSLSTAWDLSTAAYDSVSFSVATQDDNPYSSAFKSDGTKMYVLVNQTIYQYSL